MMIKLLIFVILLGCGNDVLISNPSSPMETKEQHFFEIDMLNERDFPMEVDGDEYTITISSSHQTIFKMRASTRSNKTERITWTTNKSYRWSNGLATDDYPLVNPASYTKDGYGFSMIGFLSEMKNSSVRIYGHYNGLTDSIVVHIK